MDGGHVHDARLGGCGGFCPVIPLGATVRWRDTIHKSAWSGVVTGHPSAKMVEVDGRGAISEGLLEVVEVREDFMGHREFDSELARTLAAERDGLTEIVAQQCEVIAEIQEELAACPDADEIEALREAKENASTLKDAVSDALLAITGTRRPSQRDCAWPEVWALAEAAEYFED